MTTIEWTDETWNPVTGCARVSPGCDNCYAERLANGRLKHLYPEGFEKVTCHRDRLEKPLHWKKPRRVFVNSMSDLFHPAVPSSFIKQVFYVMCRADQHTFQVLTKRPQRMAKILNEPGFWDGLAEEAPYNVWLGVSIENAAYNWRTRFLADTPAAVRFVSAEPLIGAFAESRAEHLVPLVDMDWVIVGGESGPKARPMDLVWARTLRDACEFLDIAFFVKQLGSSFGREHHDMDTWPEDLRVREWPEVVAP